MAQLLRDSQSGGRRFGELWSHFRRPVFVRCSSDSDSGGHQFRLFRMWLVGFWGCFWRKPNVQVQGAIELNFSFGYSSGFYVDVARSKPGSK